MKKPVLSALILLLSLTGATFSTFAQQFGAGIQSNANCIPFAWGNTYQKGQYIYAPTDWTFGTPASGNIQKLYWRWGFNNYSAVPNTVQNLTIKLGANNRHRIRQRQQPHRINHRN